jgi:hypothetical protein
MQLHPVLDRVGKVALMAQVTRGNMPAAVPTEATWRKSARSGAVGNCVEVALLDGGE